MKTIHTTREGWLQAATEALDELYFKGTDYPLPERLQASCGFCKGSSKAIGQCWSPEASKNQTTHIFICPTRDDPIDILATLLHELIHAAVGNEHKHKGPFKELAREFGLKGKLTATFCEEGSELHETLSAVRERLGSYPHVAMAPPKKKAASRDAWVRLCSPQDPDYKVVISPKMLEAAGAPLDPWGNEMEPV